MHTGSGVFVSTDQPLVFYIPTPVGLLSTAHDIYDTLTTPTGVTHATAVGRKALERMTEILEPMSGKVIHTGHPARYPLTSRHKRTTAWVLALPGTWPIPAAGYMTLRTPGLPPATCFRPSVRDHTLPIAALALKTTAHIVDVLCVDWAVG